MNKTPVMVLAITRDIESAAAEKYEELTQREIFNDEETCFILVLSRIMSYHRNVCGCSEPSRGYRPN
jgi:hypothetical protein